MIEGLQLVGDVVDLGFMHGLGVAAGVWKFNELEAEILAEWLLSEADRGNPIALQTVERAADNALRIRAAMVIVPKAITTIQEVTEHGIHPPFLGGKK